MKSKKVKKAKYKDSTDALVRVRRNAKTVENLHFIYVQRGTAGNGTLGALDFLNSEDYLVRFVKALPRKKELAKLKPIIDHTRAVFNSVLGIV